MTICRTLQLVIVVRQGLPGQTQQHTLTLTSSTQWAIKSCVSVSEFTCIPVDLDLGVLNSDVSLPLLGIWQEWHVMGVMVEFSS